MKFRIEWIEYAHKFKGCGGFDVRAGFNERGFKELSYEMIREGVDNLLGIYQTVYFSTEEEPDGVEVEPEIIKQILCWYINSL